MKKTHCATAIAAVAVLVMLLTFVSKRKRATQLPRGMSRIATDFQFTEGPLWLPSGVLIFSDIAANTLYVCDTGNTAAFRYHTGRANGNALDPNGAILSATHDGAIVREDPDGSLQTLVSTFEDKRLNSPDDLVVRSDGIIYFTDPDYGLGNRPRELPFNGVYRLQHQKLTLISRDLKEPNGVALSPDQKHPYVADSLGPNLHVWDIAPDGNATHERIFAVLPGATYATGIPDGVKCDRLGNVYTTGPGGLWMFNRAGTLVEKIPVPERTTNMAWGGADRRTLYITAGRSVYAIRRTIGGPIPANSNSHTPFGKTTKTQRH